MKKLIFFAFLFIVNKSASITLGTYGTNKFPIKLTYKDHKTELIYSGNYVLKNIPVQIHSKNEFDDFLIEIRIYNIKLNKKSQANFYHSIANIDNQNESKEVIIIKDPKILKSNKFFLITINGNTLQLVEQSECTIL